MQHQRIMGGASSMERGERSLAMQAFSVDSRTSSVRECNETFGLTEGQHRQFRDREVTEIYEPREEEEL